MKYGTIGSGNKVIREQSFVFAHCLPLAVKIPSGAPKLEILMAEVQLAGQYWVHNRCSGNTVRHQQMIEQDSEKCVGR